MSHKIIAFVSSILLVLIYIVRVTGVNNDEIYPVYQTYNLNDEVSIETDFFNNSNERMNGYTVMVSETELLSVSDFKKQYNVNNEDILANAEYILLINVHFKNNSNKLAENAGIDLAQYNLQESSYINFVERDVYPIVNKHDSLAFSLELNSEAEIVLPFSLNTSQLNINRFINGNPRLVVSLYPHKKAINLI